MAGEFKGVRTFSQQVSHAAAVIYAVSARCSRRRTQRDGPDENGPATLKSKVDVVQYLKDAMAYGHKAMAGSPTPI